jgi:hypothetical protein
MQECKTKHINIYMSFSNRPGLVSKARNETKNTYMDHNIAKALPQVIYTTKKNQLKIKPGMSRVRPPLRASIVFPPSSARLRESKKNPPTPTRLLFPRRPRDSVKEKNRLPVLPIAGHRTAPPGELVHVPVCRLPRALLAVVPWPSSPRYMHGATLDLGSLTSPPGSWICDSIDHLRSDHDGDRKTICTPRCALAPHDGYQLI